MLRALSHLEASSSMCNESEFFDRGSDEDVCLSFVSVVFRPVVASCDFVRCYANLLDEGFVECDVDVSVRIVPLTAQPSQTWLRDRGKSGAAGTRRGTNWKKRKTNCQGRTEVKESFDVEVSGR